MTYLNNKATTQSLLPYYGKERTLCSNFKIKIYSEIEDTPPFCLIFVFENMDTLLYSNNS